MKDDVSVKKLLIYNDVPFHYEILESVIVKYTTILNISSSLPVQIYLHIKPNTSFKKYIKEKYPSILFLTITDYDYFINCTIYDHNVGSLSSDPTKKYISHEITERLQSNPNVYFLTPLSIKNFIYTDIMPFSEQKIKTTVPIYVIQGSLKRRNIQLLVKILDKTYKHKFIIKIVGREKLPECLKKYNDKIVVKNSLDFINYHKAFLDAYCILPLITKQTHAHYYTKKLTSTINYALGYKLKCLIDADLQDIYKLKNVEVFNDINNISSAFEKTLNLFYGIK